MLKTLTRSRHGTRWALIDFAVGAISFYLGYLLSPYTEAAQVRNIYTVCFLYGVALLLSTRLINVPLIGKDYEVGRYEIVVTSLLAACAGCLTFLVLSTFIFYNVFGRYILVASALVSFVGIGGLRLLMHALHRQVPLRVALAGCTAGTFDHVAEMLNERREIQLAGLITGPNADAGPPASGTACWRSTDPQLYDQLKDHGVEIVVICNGETLPTEDRQRLLQLPLYGIELTNYRTFLETYFKRVVLDLATLEEVASLRLFPGNAPIFFSKRCLDIGLSLFALSVTAVLLPPIALLIKLESRGPLFFRQVRDGYCGKPFSMVKFRTMVHHAEQHGAQWASTADPRITGIGRILRLTRLDELPQFWNILKGEMSLVGPRPERPEFTRELLQHIPYYDYRYLLPPGLTGWAQICYRYGDSQADAKRKLEYDLYYIRHLSLFLDLCIILKTVPMLMRGSR